MKLTTYIKNKNFSLVTYFCLVIIRIVLVFIPQYAIIHPDEFFQTSEVITGETFDIEATRTWEFNNTMPIRSYAIPFIYLKIPMTIFKTIAIYIKMFLSLDLRTSYVLLIFPRIIMCAISFVNDYSIYKICTSYKLKYDLRLLTLASSSVMLTFGIRTFSNTIEMALCSSLLYLVSECMINSNTVIYQKEFLEDKYETAKKIGDRVKYYKMAQSLPPHSYSKCGVISSLCVIGVFNRPTFIFFGMPMVFHWLLRGMGSRSVSFINFNMRIVMFILSGLPALCTIIFIDSLYYGYLSLAQVYIMDVTLYSFIVTPLNFIRYNINPDNTASHGEHPKWLHLLVNIPLLYNILGVIAICSFGTMFYKFCRKEFQNLPRAQSFVSLMNSSIFVPVLMMSLINHQEARFLIPVTVPLIMLHAPKLITGVNLTSYMRECQWDFIRKISNKITITISGRFILKVWYAFNILFTLVFGFIHQAGVIQLADHFSRLHQIRAPTTQIHLITSHIYNIPESLLILPSVNLLYTNPQTNQKFKMARRFFLYEYGSMDMDMLYENIKMTLDASELKAATTKHRYQMYLAIPSSKADDLNQVFHKHTNNSIIRYKEEKIFYPHLSTEAFPNFKSMHPLINNKFVFN
ncbi:unnamed protein product, partial [Diamesa serratosioi]